MLGTIELYKLAFTPNDTMYFDSAESQNAWFESQPKLKIDNISFNGARAFQIGNNYLDVIFDYNYVRYKLNNRYIYAFIENVDYANDNCATLQISIDLNQTFLREIQTAIATSNVGNFTIKESKFEEKFIPYSNKVTIPYYKAEEVNNLLAPVFIDNVVYYLGYIMINIDSNAFIDLPIADRPSRLQENGLTLPCCCIALPIFYNPTTKQLKTNINCMCPNFSGGTNYDICNANDLPELLTKYASYITSSCIAITFNHLCILSNDYTNSIPAMRPVDWDNDNQKLIFKLPTNSGTLEYSEHVCLSVPSISKRLLIITKNVKVFHKTFNLSSIISQIPEPLRREPYLYIRIGNDTEYITLNLAEFITPQGYTRDTNLFIQYFNSCAYPYTTNFRFSYGNGIYVDRNYFFNLTTSTPIPYSISAWQSYFSQHSASVNDGLATQQKYDREISKQNRDMSMAQGGLNMATSIAQGVANVGIGLATLNPSQVIHGGISGISGAGQGAMQIANANVQYNNSELERKKQKALLQISWNDIKSSPSEYSNIMSNVTTFYANGIQGIEIDLYIAINIDDIIKYHKQYGYKINRMETLTWADIQQHTVFDYISFNTITLKSTLPQFYTAMIEQQYEQGVRFWYDYANFMNYQIENTERS